MGSSGERTSSIWFHRAISCRCMVERFIGRWVSCLRGSNSKASRNFVFQPVPAYLAIPGAGIKNIHVLLKAHLNPPLLPPPVSGLYRNTGYRGHSPSYQTTHYETKYLGIKSPSGFAKTRSSFLFSARHYIQNTLFHRMCSL